MTETSRDLLLSTAISLKIDTVTAEVVREFQKEGIESILLKGPSFQRGLYSSGMPRPYRDSDLLVRPEAVHAAELILVGLRFSKMELGRIPNVAGSPSHARSWVRGSDTSVIDLHVTLPLVPAPPESVFQVLKANTELMHVGGHEVQVLNLAGLCFHAAIHACQHWPSPRVEIDLQQALALSDITWQEAAQIAESLNSSDLLVVGTSRVPQGTLLLQRLRLAAGSNSLPTAHPPQEEGIAWFWRELCSVKGIARLRYLTRVFVPRVQYMKSVWEIAGRGGLGLALAYVIHPMFLFVRLVTSIGRRKGRSGPRRRYHRKHDT